MKGFKRSNEHNNKASIKVTQIRSKIKKNGDI